MISERTKAVLSAAKKRGTRLGNPNLPQAAKRGIAALKANARQFAANVRPVIEEIMRAGATSPTSAMSARHAAGNGRMCRWGQFCTLSSQAPGA